MTFSNDQRCTVDLVVGSNILPQILTMTWELLFLFLCGYQSDYITLYNQRYFKCCDGRVVKASVLR
jgi:hypothetical protein